MLESERGSPFHAHLEGKDGLREALFIAELIDHVIATGDDEGMARKAHTVYLAFGFSILSL